MRNIPYNLKLLALSNGCTFAENVLDVIVFATTARMLAYNPVGFPIGTIRDGVVENGFVYEKFAVAVVPFV